MLTGRTSFTATLSPLTFFYTPMADFGIARIMEESPEAALTRTGALIGTPDYMAPEMVRGETIDYRADIYELGVVLFQLLSARVPFTGTSPYATLIRHVQEPLPHLHELNPEIPASVDAVIQKATAKKREDRYTTVRAMAQALRDAFTQPERLASLPPDPQENIPTATASYAPLMATAKTRPQPDTTPVQQQSLDTPIAHKETLNETATPPQNNQPVAPTSQTPPIYQARPAQNRNPWKLALAAVLIVTLVMTVVGYISASTHKTSQFINTPSGKTYMTTPVPATPSAVTTSSSNTTTSVSTTSSTTNTGPAYVTTPVPTATSAPTTDATPTITDSTSTTTASASIPFGAKLYSTSSPGPSCDSGGGQWATYNGAQVSCQNGATQISNTASTASLQGLFLTAIPGQTYPANYIVQVQLQQTSTSSNDFGIYFRNQPGSNQQGTYTFMMHANGTWSAYAYDNNTGAATQIASGQFGDAHTQVTLDIVVNGQQFSFYANGNELGSISNALYTSGTTGIAVDQGSSVVVSNFTLYAIAS
jgi:serine/threonine protein kinase